MRRSQSRHKLIKAVGAILIAIIVAGFIALLYLKITTGQGVQTYYSGTQVARNYIGTAITIGLAAVIGIAIAITYLARQFKKGNGT